MNSLQKNTRIPAAPTPAAGVRQRDRRPPVAVMTRTLLVVARAFPVMRRRPAILGRALPVALAILCAWSGPAASQGFDVLGVRPGIRAGGSMGRLSLSTKPEGVDSQWQPGFVVGATLAYEELPVVGLELQVLYFEQGGELEGSLELLNEVFEGQAQIRMAYLMIPFLANFKVREATVRPYAKLGPQVGFRISSKAELRSVDLTGGSLETDIKEETNSVDFSLYFAGGLDFPLTTVSAYLEVGYSVGFTDLFKATADVTDLFQGKSHALGITAGLSY